MWYCRSCKKGGDTVTFVRELRGCGYEEALAYLTDRFGPPDEDDAAFQSTLRTVEEAGITKVHVFPYSPRPGTDTAAEDTVPLAVKRERSARLRELSAAACRQRWTDKLGSEEVVLVDRAGRGYGDDYSPWLVQAPIGSLVRARAYAVTVEGILGIAA